MKKPLRPLALLFALAAISLPACSNQNAEDSSHPAAAGKKINAQDINADNVVIDDNGMAKVMGAMAFPLGVPGAGGELQFTGQLGQPKPMGPTIVYIFKTISPGVKETMAKEKISVSENTAYLLPENAELGIEDIRAAREIGPIDLSLSDDELAAQYGLVMNDDQDPAGDNAEDAPVE